MSQSFKSQFRTIARSVGYRMGKAEATRQLRGLKDGWYPNFQDLFTPEYLDDVERGYDEGMAYARKQWEEKRQRIERFEAYYRTIP